MILDAGRRYELKLLKKIETGAVPYNYYCPVFNGERLIYFVLNKDGNAVIRCEDIDSGKTVWEHCLDKAVPGGCVRQLVGGVMWQDQILFATEHSIFSLNLETGSKTMDIAVETDRPELTIAGDTLFVTSGNELIKIDLTKGKIVKRKKYRVKWLVGPAREESGRLYVSTSNSKILRINEGDLAADLEYKYPGSWSVGVPAGIVGDRLVGSSYSQYVVSFDKNTGEILWQKKKKTGSEPSQVIDADGGVIYHCENLNNKMITALRISDGKKLWDREAEIRGITDLDTNTLVGFLKNESGEYEFTKISKKTGDFEPIEDAPKMHENTEEPYSHYRMPLEIAVSGRFFIFACGTGDIYVFEKWTKAEC